MVQQIGAFGVCVILREGTFEHLEGVRKWFTDQLESSHSYEMAYEITVQRPISGRAHTQTICDPRVNVPIEWIRQFLQEVPNCSEAGTVTSCQMRCFDKQTRGFIPINIQMIQDYLAGIEQDMSLLPRWSVVDLSTPEQEE